jgi:AraC family transcriptional regulator
VRGNNRERSTSKSGGNGLLVQGSYGSWQYLESVDIVHIYVRNELLADLSVQEGGPGTAELRECLDLHDPLLNTLTQEVANTLGQQPRSRLHADSLGLMISMRLLKFHLDRPLSLGVKVGGLAPWQLARATEALSDRLNEEPSLDEIAALVRLSKFHFLRAFRMSTGLPPHRYLMNLRVARARQLLETTDLSVTEIAGEVGYDDPGYLARLFRRRFGTTPARYRRERRS